MPQIVIGPQVYGQVDGSTHKAIHGFLMKLAKDDTAPGLHIEKIENSADPRIRTGRVTQMWRAVIVKVQGAGAEAYYIYLGTFAHDEGIEVARKIRIAVNPRNGIAELIKADQATSVGAAAPVPALGAVEEAVPGSASATVAAVAPDETTPTLREREFVVADLTALGIDETFAAGALDIASTDELLGYAEQAPAKWQGEALLDIFTGTSLADVRENYRLGLVTEESVAPAGADPSDAELLLALQHPAAQMEFAFIDDDNDLRAAVENPDFAAWRIFLHPSQANLVEKKWHGPARVSGGAGTGKTVILLHRARALWRKNPDARIVLTTYNRTLAEALFDQIRQLDARVPIASKMGDPGVFVAGVDSLVHQVLALGKGQLGGTDLGTGAVAAVLGPRVANLTAPTDESAVWTRAGTAPSAQVLPEVLRSPTFLIAEYAAVILPAKVTTKDAYLKVRRTGRGVALDRRKRAAVWDIVEAYRAEASAAGSADFDEKARVAAEVLDQRAANGKPRPVDHVLVDESQDLTPSRLLFLRALVGRGDNDLFLAEDPHQRIYTARVPLTRFGIEITGRAKRLKLNYRTTEQNLRFALKIVAGEQYTDGVDETVDAVGYRSARRGPTPTLHPVDSLSAVFDESAALVTEWLADSANPVQPHTIGLLVSSRREGEQLVRALGERGVAARFVDRHASAGQGKVLVMTMHRAKGMEFARAILVGVSRESLPAKFRLAGVPEEDMAEALQRERSLLYVAATRARDRLAVVWSGTPSDLLPTIQVTDRLGVPRESN